MSADKISSTDEINKNNDISKISYDEDKVIPVEFEVRYFLIY